jgi:GntR family transcriptional regulator, transcriptional repressor for pyruvate dehydrogenase complex
MIRNFLPSRPAKRELVSSRIMNQIVDQLLSSHLKPGDKLPTEFDLAAEFGVARNSVREAIKMLSSLGVIEIRRGQGTFIAQSQSTAVVDALALNLVFGEKTSTELFELREMLEHAVMQLAARKAQDEDIRELEEINQQLKKVGSDQKAVRQLDLSFHLTLLKATQNSLLRKIGKAIYTLFFASLGDAEINPSVIHTDHARVIATIRGREPEAARRMVEAHLSTWENIIRRAEASSCKHR